MEGRLNTLKAAQYGEENRIDFLADGGSNDHNADLLQDGFSNNMNVGQFGNLQRIDATQRGRNNLLNVEQGQLGSQPAGVSIANNVINSLQRGNGNVANLKQDRN